jgi:hypothetical protein
MRLGSEKPQSHEFILLIFPVAEPDSTPIPGTKPVEPVSIYPYVKNRKIITINKSDTDEDMVTAPTSLEVLIAK